MAEAPKIPQIVRERLRTQQRGIQVGGEHPDADMLTAFSEDALPAGERSLVTSHLSACDSCREVVMLSQTAAAETGELLKVPASRTPGWMGFRWAALAACLVLTVGVVLFERSSRTSSSQQTALTAPPSASAPATPDLQDKLEVESATVALPANEKPADKESGRAKRREAEPAERAFQAYGYADMKANSVGRPFNGARESIGRLKREPARTEADSFSYSPNSNANEAVDFGSTGQIRPAAPPAPSSNRGLAQGGTTGGPIAGSSGAATLQKRENSNLAKVAPGVVAGNAAEESFSGDQVTGARFAEQEPGKKKVADESLPLATQAAASRPLARDDRSAVAQSLARSASTSSMVNFEAKDQPEVPAATAEATATASAAPMQWRIRSGKLQHSTDFGKTWQQVMMPINVTLRAFWALGNSVWAGGTSGALFHFSDGGKNSVRVPIETDEGEISETVVSVSFSDDLHGIITLENGQILETDDGGKTWRKR